ncbi:spore germination protein GerW family protein [Paraconexibacter sp.]|uniref:spore germination protein GerW family protein n=1 Tax=Paraconexibacter sp. TaxID=2949640 RepID=UPI0035640733
MAKKDGAERRLRPGRGKPRGLSTLRRMVTRIDGSKLCFGDPVRAEGTTVIPVARVWAAGGLGYGFGPGDDATPDDPEAGGGGGGGFVDAHPIGFITVGPDGATRYEAIPDPQGRARAARALASGAATLMTGYAAARALRAGNDRRSRTRRGAAAAMLRRGTD